MILKQKFLGLGFTLILGVQAESVIPAKYIIEQSVNLFDLAARDIVDIKGKPKTPKQIKEENLAHLQAFIDFDIRKIPSARGSDAKKPEYISITDAKDTLQSAINHKVVGLEHYEEYDPKKLGIGYCFGRAMYVHLDLTFRGLSRVATQKAFVIGNMKTSDGTNWGWHVTTIAQSKGKNGKEIWLAIDPIEGVVDVHDWYESMLKNYSTDKKLKLYITFGTRLATDQNSGYDEDSVKDPFYHKYFIKMREEVVKEADKGDLGRYGKKKLPIY